MTISISDELARQTGLTDRELLIEFACWLFDSDRLELAAAARLAKVNRTEFESELRKRKIPSLRPNSEDLAQDLATIRHLEQVRKSEGAG